MAEELTMRLTMTKRQALVMGGLIILVAAAAVVGSRFFPGAVEASVGAPVESAEPMAVQTMSAEKSQSYTRERHYTGLLRETRRSQLSFQVGGELVALLVDEGDEVEAGQTIGRIDDRHVRARQAQLSAQHAEAQAVLDELVEGPRQETIAAKRAELREVIAKRNVLERQVERRQQLVRTTSVSREEYELFLFEFQAAEARVDVIQKRLDELLAGSRKEQIAAQRARVSQLDAQLTDVEHDLQDMQLTAPFAGHIAKRLVDEGAVIHPGTVVVELLDLSLLEAWIGIPPGPTAALEIGQTLAVTVDGRQLPATVKALAPDVDITTRTRNVILQLECSGESLCLPGQLVRIAIREKVPMAGFWVPTTALTSAAHGLWTLYVAEEKNDRLVVGRRNIELLDTSGDHSFVRGTLRSGDLIISDGTHRIVPGQAVVLGRSCDVD
jgi:multidrug efflux pump subunit AcrA (membrane-fusion protein)